MPDILARVSKGAKRPGLVVGFAAETEAVVAHATAKRLRKGCDWIVANDVSPATGIMGGTENAVVLISDRRGRGLAADDQGRGGAAAGRPDRGGVDPDLRRDRGGGRGLRRGYF